MFDAHDTEQNKLKVFRHNRKWKKVIDEFLSAWTEFFNKETGHNESWNKPPSLSVEGMGLCVRWIKNGGVHYNWTLTIFRISHKRTFPLLRPKRIESGIISFQRWRSVDWNIMGVNYDRLIDIVSAIRLLREHTIVAEDACEAHEDNMEIFNDYLDGLAEVM